MPYYNESDESYHERISYEESTDSDRYVRMLSDVTDICNGMRFKGGFRIEKKWMKKSI